MTALMLAASQNNIAATYFLRTYEANERSPEGLTALEIGLKSQNFQCAELLVELELDEVSKLTLKRYFIPQNGFPGLLMHYNQPEL